MRNNTQQVASYALSCGIPSAAIHYGVKESTVERYMRTHRDIWPMPAAKLPRPTVSNQLTKEEAQELFGYGGGLLFWAHDVSRSVKENDQAGCLCTTGYYKVRYKGRPYKTHNLIWNFHHGLIPAGLTVDHIDGNCRKNPIENLRLATPEMQVVNREACRNRSKWGVGVSCSSEGRYAATFRSIHLGTFGSPMEARECVGYVREFWMRMQCEVVERMMAGQPELATYKRTKANGADWTKRVARWWIASC